MATNDYVAHAPGYVDNEGPKIVTSRFAYDDSYSLARFEATGGYDGLRGALSITPAKVHEEVREATLLGRGGAGFPAGIKWGFLPGGKFPYYLVVNGDESEPGTYKDRLLMERDPHQLIEGCLIACYALGLQQCFLYVRVSPPSSTTSRPSPICPGSCATARRITRNTDRTHHRARGCSRSPDT
jgi:NADH-quinone oxidoreductase subunit F